MRANLTKTNGVRRVVENRHLLRIILENTTGGGVSLRQYSGEKPATANPTKPMLPIILTKMRFVLKIIFFPRLFLYLSSVF